MGEELFERGTEVVGPVGRQEGARLIDPILLGIGPGEGGKESEVFLERVDVKDAGGVVRIAEDFEELVVAEKGMVGPVFEGGEGNSF